MHIYVCSRTERATTAGYIVRKAKQYTKTIVKTIKDDCEIADDGGAAHAQELMVKSAKVSTAHARSSQYEFK